MSALPRISTITPRAGKLRAWHIKGSLLGRTHPLCFPDVETWNQWSALNRAVSQEARAHFCEDCSAAYQHRMTQLNRCVHPEYGVRG